LFKFISITLQIILILVLTLIVINNSFIISFEINDFLYSISSSYIFLIFLVFFLLIFLLQTFYFKTKFNFSKYRVSKMIKNKEKGYHAFVNGMIALSNKDYKKAILESKKISNYLDGNPSLSLLLKSEVFKVEKKYDELHTIYEKMIKNYNTENLGYRGLMEQYLRSQDYHHAFLYGEKLFNKNPFIEKIYETLVNIIAKTNNWQQLIVITEKALSKKVIDKREYQENKSIGFFEIAKIKQFSEPHESINLIQKAIKLRRNFSPYVKLYIELMIQNKKYAEAKKYIKKVWSETAHSEYKVLIQKLATHLNTSFSDLAKYVVGSSYSNEESKILLIEASIHDKKWPEARSQIKDLLDVKPKKQICLLMAKIEEGDSNDIQKMDAWTLRAKNGDPSNLWICGITHKSQDEWASLSEAGYFNSLVWQQPTMLNQIQISKDYEN